MIVDNLIVCACFVMLVGEIRCGFVFLISTLIKLVGVKLNKITLLFTLNNSIIFNHGNVAINTRLRLTSTQLLN